MQESGPLTSEINQNVTFTANEANVTNSKDQLHDHWTAMLPREVKELGISSLAQGSSADPIELLRPIALLLCQTIDVCLGSRQKLSCDQVSPVGRSQPQLNSADTSQIVTQLLKSKQEDGLSRRYLDTMRSHLTRFAAAFPVQIAGIAAPQMEQWLRGLNIGARSRNNIRGSVVTLFHFARKQGYLRKGQPTEADDLAVAKDRGGAIGVLKPEQLALVLASAPSREELYLALGAFTGMRSSEIIRLDWSAVNFERLFITVAADKAKTATRRLVPIHPNLAQWLEPHRGSKGQPFPTGVVAERAIAFAKRCGIRWPQNALRHSYATYRLALIADAARVALEMGNSPSKLMTNYRELADEEEAKAWFAICPAP